MTNPLVETIKKLLWPLILCLVLVVIYWGMSNFNIQDHSFGLHPRDFNHWQGILTSAFIHGSAEHLLSNVLSFFCLGGLLFIFYWRIAKRVLLLSWIFTGIIMFLFARSEFFHIGASGVIYAMAFFLVTAGFLSGHAALRVISLIVILYYGSMVWGFLPLDSKVSWDGHLSGAAAGILVAFIFAKKYKLDYPKNLPDWFNEPYEEPDDYSGLGD
jgi:membrane associated rhomboid family serine protease